MSTKDVYHIQLKKQKKLPFGEEVVFSNEKFNWNLKVDN
jgi:hypothetical protein